jgi:hypothetical protein
VQFTAHIEQQVQLDKQEFVVADVCTRWFYHQLRPKSPTQGAEAQPTSAGAAGGDGDCRAKYPGGIVGAREDLSRTQSHLSLSLTFYEFALVGDADDDDRYSEAELRDMLEAFGVVVDGPMSDAIMLATLNNKFDAVRQFGGLEPLMAGMELLQGKGYRFTSHDREALGRIMG